MVNTQPIEGMLYRIYATEHKFPIEPDLKECRSLVTKEVITGNFVKGKTILRHDSRRLAEVLSLMCTENSPCTSASIEINDEKNLMELGESANL